jgi:hypothetical protein
MLRGWTAALAATLCAIGASDARAAPRVAFVVGNAGYQNAAPLANPLNDARAIGEALERLGFKVHLALDSSQDELLGALDAFSADLIGAEAAIFYYSGHGMQIDGTNYLLPVDIEVENERSIRYGAIDVAEVIHDMEQEAEVSIVVLDACRDNPFLADLQKKAGTRSVAASRGLAPIKSTGNGTLIAYAAEPGAVASDGEGEHSPYTNSLLEEIEVPNVEVGLVFRRVAGTVVEETEGRQHPELLVRLTREFYLKTEAVPVAAAPSVPAPPTETAATPPPPVAPTDAIVIAAAPPVEREPAPDRTSAGPVAERRPYAALLDRLNLAGPVYRPASLWTPRDWTSYGEAEPNSTIGTANPLELDSRVQLTLDPVGDGDYFYFNVGSGGELHLLSEAVPAEIDLAARILDANGRDVASWVTAPRPGGVLDAVIDLPDAGAYWLEVRDNYNDAGSGGWVNLAVAFSAEHDGYEPDNQASQARTIALDGEVEAAILPRGDADWYRFAIDRPGELSVTVEEVPENLDIAVRLHDADFKIVGDWVVPPRPGGVTQALFGIQRPGFYFLEVADSYNDARSVKPFRIKTAFAPSPDDYEPNDSFSTATLIPATGEHRLAIFPRGEADWFRVDIDDPGELTIAATGVPANLDLAFQVTDADKNVILNWVAAPRPGGDVTGFVDLAQAGTYYIELRDSYNDQGAIGPIALKTRFIRAPDQYEPNDSPGLATDLRPGGEIAFNILPRNDADWFRVTVEEPGELAIAVDNGPENLDIHFRVMDADQRELLTWVPPYAKGGRTEGTVDLPAPGSYYIEVRDGANDDRSIRHATLSTAFTPTVMSYEPNNSFGNATPVNLVGENLAHILPRGDADWYVVYAPGPGHLEVWAEDVPENIDVAMRVLDADQRDLTGWLVPPRPGGVTSGAVDLAAAGWYRLEIRDSYDDQRSPKPFKIRRAFTPAP